MTRVHVVALGGTISMTSEDHGSLEPRLDADQLLELLDGEVAGATTITTESPPPMPSANLTLDDIVGVVRRVHELLDAGDIDGAVVVQGTDTLEETAFVADVLHTDRSEPLVFTAAMRAPDTLGTDAAANLAASMAVAASPDAAGHGVIVCMNDELHAARWVQKTHASSTAAFTSPTSGPIGHVVERRPRFRQRRSTQLDGIGPARLGADPARVLLHRTFLGDDGRVISGARQLGYDGVVVEAFGVGHLSVAAAHAAAGLAAQIPVVFASRASVGSTFTDTYGFEGSERDLLRRGLIAAGSLDGLKARALLEIALSSEMDVASLPELFAAWG